MADSKRQQVVDALVTRLETISTVNGFETNAGTNVFQWRGYDIPDNKRPAIDVRDSEQTLETEAGEADRHTLVVEINCFAAGADSPADIRKIMADVVKAIRDDPSFPRLGGEGVAEDVNLVQQTIEDVEHKEERITAGQVGITIEFMTAHFNSYTGGN